MQRDIELSGCGFSLEESSNPSDGLRLQVGGGSRAAVRTTAAGEAAVRTEMHVSFTEDLTTESDARQAASFESLLFGSGHFCGFARDEFDPTSRATRVPSTGVKLVDTALFRQGEDESFSSRDLKFSDRIYY